MAEPTSPIRKYTGMLREHAARSQAPDAFQRFFREAGKTFKRGKPVWTNFAVYCQKPTMKHPLTIKMSMHNNEGRAFMQMPIDEFDKMIDELTSWRLEHDQEIFQLIEENGRLMRNRSYLDRMETLLSKTDYSAPPKITIDGVNITELSITREKEIIFKMLETLPNSNNKTFLIADIVKRITELQAMDIDCSDITQKLEELITNLEIQYKEDYGESIRPHPGKILPNSESDTTYERL